MRKTWRRQLALGLAVVTIWTSGNAAHFYAGQKDCETPAISTERLTDTEQKINLDKVNYQVKKSAYASVFDASYYAKNNKDLKIAFGNDENALQAALEDAMNEGIKVSCLDAKVTEASDGGTEVILGSPFKFDPSNIDEWKDVY